MSTFTKHDSGKLRWSLLFHPKLVRALEYCVRVLMHGAEKYSDHNWANCEDTTRYADAEMRHKLAGEWDDVESGLPHRAHKIVSALFEFALELDKRGTPAKCGLCSGTGKLRVDSTGLRLEVTQPCPQCNGSGWGI